MQLPELLGQSCHRFAAVAAAIIVGVAAAVVVFAVAVAIAVAAAHFQFVFVVATRLVNKIRRKMPKSVEVVEGV